MTKPKRPTIRDVAEKAGVSKSLVSLVMRNAPNVSEQRRAAVLTAAKELGYRPNAVARSLVQRRTHIVGVMLSDLHNPFFAEVVDGIQDAITDPRYRILITTGNRVARREEDAVDMLLELRVDGMILAGPVLEMSQVVAAAKEVPIVLVGRSTKAGSVDGVINDDRAGGGLVVDHLVGLGHRRIAHIHGGGGAGARRRRQGYEEAMHHHGLADEIQTVAGAFTEEGGARAMRRLLESDRRPSAVFAANDLAAVGVLEVLDGAGLAVPDDISVVGYDNTHLAQLPTVALTTIDQPRLLMGATALELLLERLIDGRQDARHLVLAPTLVARSSTGPPPR